MANSSKAKAIRLGVLLVILLLIVVAKAFFISYYRIPQNGMYPTLPAGSTLFAWRHPHANASAVERGDIVIFPRVENGQNYVYIWRVVALPGETILTSGDASYEIAIETSPTSPEPDVSLTVPPDQVFVMGDNRLDAHDSRYFGPIPVGSIIGKKL